jgi:glutaredoxin
MPLALAGLMLGAPAWALYKIVGPDGKVTYTDVPPTSVQGKVVPMGGQGSAGSSDVALPYGLRNVVSRFPVTLYTTVACEPCDQGRALLRQRGVPYQERIASSDAERDAWMKLVGGAQAPVLQIGAQMLRGLSINDWNSHLDAAGYPARSQLPPNYVQPPAQPLVPQAAAQTAQPPAPPKPPAAPPPPPSESGIRF